MVKQPLEGVKVVDLTYYAAGPGTAKILADWGADVVKIEPPTGDPARNIATQMGMPQTDEINPFYSIYNSNKRGVCLDLKSPEGLVIMDRLLTKANIFVTSFRPGALQRMGLDYETMSQKHPHIVYGTLNGYGELGPAKDKAGFDSVSFWARSGSMISLMEKDATPPNPTIAFGDNTAACSLSGGICAGLYYQAVTGKGCKVLISLMSQAIWNLSPVIASGQWGDTYPKSRYAPMSPYNSFFKTKDDKWTFMSILDYDRMRSGLFRVLEREDLLGDLRFKDSTTCRIHSRDLVEIIDEVLQKFTQEEFIARLDAEDIANEKINPAIDIIHDPQAIANNYVVDYIHRDGQISKQGLPPVKFGNVDVVMKYPETPAIGEHTEAVLKELGYSAEEIAVLFAKNVAIQR